MPCLFKSSSFLTCANAAYLFTIVNAAINSHSLILPAAQAVNLVSMLAVWKLPPLPFPTFTSVVHSISKMYGRINLIALKTSTATPLILSKLSNQVLFWLWPKWPAQSSVQFQLWPSCPKCYGLHTHFTLSILDIH